jgi:hypothetical protein
MTCAWFKQQFHDKINAALTGTPYSLDFMTALAVQPSPAEPGGPLYSVTSTDPLRLRSEPL